MLRLVDSKARFSKHASHFKFPVRDDHTSIRRWRMTHGGFFMLIKLRCFGNLPIFQTLFGGVLFVCFFVTQTTFSADHFTLLEFTSQNCPACRQIEPLVRQLVEKGYPIRQVDAYAESQLAEQCGIKTLPAFVVWADGRVIDRIEGIVDGFALERRLTSALEKGQAANVPSNSTRGNLPVYQQVSLSQPLAVQPVVQPIATNGLSANAVPWLQATVRLRVESPSGHDWGTGTIIDARNGEALILTCGHIFRDSQGQGRVEVDLYCGNTSRRVPGVCLKYDADQLDLGLVKISPQFGVDVIPIAPQGTELWENMPLLSTGCDNGGNPTIRQHHVRSLGNVAPFIGAPFHYIQVDNAPVQGRSGGGIFTETGYLVGVCVAGNSDENEGLFVPVSVIRNELDKVNLSCVYQTPSVTRSNASPIVLAGAEVAQPLSQQAVVVNQQPITQPIFNPAADSANIAQSSFASPVVPNATQDIYQKELNPPAPLALKQPAFQKTGLSDREIATIEELQRRQSEGDEIIVIVRSKRNPDQPCEVIQLSEISPAFLESLTKADANFAQNSR